MSRSALTRHAATGLGIGAIAALVAIAVGAIAQPFEDLTYDWRLRRAASAGRSDIVVIEIDEASLRTLAPIFGRWPWPRVVHAGVIDYLARAHARVVAYDVLFTERDTRGSFDVGSGTMTGAASDAALVDSVRRAGNVVLLGEATFDGDPTKALPPAPQMPGVVYAPGPGFQAQPWFSPPFAALNAVARGMGHDRLVKDPGGGVVRRMLPFMDASGVAVPVLGLEAALVSQSTPLDQVRLEGDELRLGAVRMPVLADPVLIEHNGADTPSDPAAVSPPPQTIASRQALVDFRGGATAYLTYPFFNVLKSEDQIESGRAPLLDLSLFRDKIVFVGTSAAGLFDLHVTPFGPVPGVDIHAAIADDVLSHRVMRRASRPVNLAVAAVAAVAAGLLATMVPGAWATGIVLALVTVVIAILTHDVRAGLWLDLVRPVTGIAVALFGGVAWQYLVEGREKRKVRHLFGRYVSRDVIHVLVSDPSRATLGGERRDMTVLFSDIRGFTTHSEARAPEAIVVQLNEYFSEMVAILFRHQGTLDKFVGDMVMGLFGAPVADDAHADHAVATAIDMVAGLARLNARWRGDGRPELDIGIGINSGEMIAGNIGSDTIMSYTVIGDEVNLGSRLESLNKDYGTHILISQATRDRLTMPVTTRLIGEVTVKGRTQAVTVYEVVVSSPENRTQDSFT